MEKKKKKKKKMYSHNWRGKRMNGAHEINLTVK